MNVPTEKAVNTNGSGTRAYAEPLAISWPYIEVPSMRGDQGVTEGRSIIAEPQNDPPR